MGNTYENLEMLYQQALQGDASSMVQFALSNHDRRSGMRKHIANAQEEFEWYKKAADMGFADAYSLVGRRYLWGQGTDVDYIKAAEYFEKALAVGDESWTSLAKQKLDDMLMDWMVASRRGEEEECEKLLLGRDALEKALGYPSMKELLAQRNTMSRIKEYIASSPSRPLLVWFTSNDSLDDLRGSIEALSGCTQVRYRPCPMGQFSAPYNFKNGKTEFFLYHTYFDQLCEENIAYCHELMQNLHLPVVCLVNDYSDYEGFDRTQFEECSCIY